MSRRDTIIIAVLINACLIVVLFATATPKKEPAPYSSRKEPAIFPCAPNINIDEIEQALVQDVNFQNPPLLSKPQIPSSPDQNLTAQLSKEEIKLNEVLEKEVETPIEITVKRGDYLDKIARENSTSVEEIMKLNRLSTTQLRIGQVLKIPTKLNSLKVQSSNDTLKHYIVKNGDTVWKIARDHHMKLEDLKKLNHLNNESAKRLQPGDTLIVH